MCHAMDSFLKCLEDKTEFFFYFIFDFSFVYIFQLRFTYVPYLFWILFYS